MVFDSTLTSVQTIMYPVIIIDNGFCDEDVTNDALFGSYQWPETRVNENGALPCAFGGPIEFENPVATRTCASRGVWRVDPEYSQCYTFITMMYAEINIVSDSHRYIIHYTTFCCFVG